MADEQQADQFEEQFRDMTDEEYERSFGADEDLEELDPEVEHSTPGEPMDDELFGDHIDQRMHIEE